MKIKNQAKGKMANIFETKARDQKDGEPARGGWEKMKVRDKRFSPGSHGNRSVCILLTRRSTDLQPTSKDLKSNPNMPPIFAGSIQTKKKGELQDIANALHLDDRGTKDELQTRIKKYLDNNQDLEDDPAFAGLFGRRKRSVQPQTSVPR